MVSERCAGFGVRIFAGKKLGYDPPRWIWLGTFGSREEAEQVEHDAQAELEAAYRKRVDALVKRKSTIATGRGSDDHWVYHCFNAEGQLLYVGITSTGFRRLRIHGNDKEWWPEVANVKIDHHPSAESALEAETRLIRDLQPPYNKRGVVAPKRASRANPDASRRTVLEEVA